MPGEFDAEHLRNSDGASDEKMTPTSTFIKARLSVDTPKQELVRGKNLSPAKRQKLRQEAGNLDQGSLSLLSLTNDVLQGIMRSLDARSLVLLAACSKSQRLWGSRTERKRYEQVAEKKLLELDGGRKHAVRWRHYSWIERLHLEEVFSRFNMETCSKEGFAFTHDSNNNLSNIKLEGVGPKMLVSHQNTSDTPLLRWRFEVLGNSALEFGVIPAGFQDNPKALHKCLAGPDGVGACGFSSTITIGSSLPIRLPVMKGSIVEVVATSSKLEFIIENPVNGFETVWHTNQVTRSIPYKGPTEIRFEQSLTPNVPMRLAATCWNRASLKILYEPPMGSPQQ
eukprot:gene7945-1160_t